jgi:hypothetical protein
MGRKGALATSEANDGESLFAEAACCKSGLDFRLVRFVRHGRAGFRRLFRGLRWVYPAPP